MRLIHSVRQVIDMKFTQQFLGFSFATLVVFWLANYFFPQHVVFGNILLNYAAALIVSALLVGFLVAWIGELVSKMKYSPSQWFLLYWVVNVVVVWAIARTPLSNIVAMGLPGFWVAVLLGLALNVAQYGVWKIMPAPAKKK